MRLLPCAVIVTLAAALPAEADPVTFAIETVESGASSSVCCVDLDVDATLDPHLLFSGSMGSTYLVKHAGLWTGRVFPNGFAGSQALDSQGRPHLTWAVHFQTNITLDSLRYATEDAGVWTVEAADHSPSMRFYSSVAIDSDQQPHVAYMKFSQFGFPNESDIHYRARLAGVWQEPLGSPLGTPQKVYLALDAQDQPWIVVLSQSGSFLQPKILTPNGGGGWNVETLAPITPFNGVSKPSFDAGGTLHLALIDNATQDVWYGSRGAGGWTFETASSRVQTGFLALALDASGEPHIAFYDPGLHEVVYAHRAGGTWTEQTVEASVTLGTPPDIDVDAGGNIHIAYTRSDGQLRYAVAPPAPVLAVAPPKANGGGLELSAAPNPARGRAQFRFRLPGPTWATLDILDVSGRVLQRLLDHASLEGREHVMAPRSGFPSGVYLARLQTGHGERTIRFAVIE